MDEKNDPWFMAKDICDVLDLRTNNGGTTWHMRALRPDEWKVVKYGDLKPTGTKSASKNFGGKEPFPHVKVTIMNEAGTHRLAMRSNEETGRPPCQGRATLLLARCEPIR